MRRIVCLAAAGLVTGLIALVPIAHATNVTARSMPNGDVTAGSSSGTSTNKDKDADFSTVTQSEALGLHWFVSNNAGTGQTMALDVVLDGPGTERDMTLVDEDVFLGPPGPQGSDLVQGRFEFQVKRKTWPEGTYFLHVTGSGSESVTATSTFTIAY